MKTLDCFVDVRSSSWCGLTINHNQHTVIRKLSNFQEDIVERSVVQIILLKSKQTKILLFN